MITIELSHLIEPTMPVYPDTAQPSVSICNTIETHGFEERLISFSSHTGTHIDAPRHLFPEGPSLDMYPIGHFMGPGLVIQARHITGSITLEDLLPYESQIREAEYILIETEWSKKWKQSSYFSGYPTLTQESARWLTTFELKGIGVDAISFDPVEEETLPVHRILLQAGFILVENLTNLGSLGSKRFTFSCIPLPVPEADGSPVHACGFLTKERWA